MLRRDAWPLPKFGIVLVYLVPLLAFAFLALYGAGGAFPPGLNHDAAWMGLYALRIVNGEPFTVYTPEAFGHETLYHYTMAALFRLWGASKLTLELTSTLFGALAVVAFVWLIRLRIQDNWLALVLSLPFSFSAALVVYARCGWQIITLVPAVALVAGCAFWCRQVAEHAANSEKEPTTERVLRFDWRLATPAIALGAACALVLYTYNGGRAIVFFGPIFWLGCWLQFKRSRVVSGVVARQAGAWLIAFLVVAAPMLLYALAHPTEWSGRASSLMGAPRSLALLEKQAFEALGFFNVSARGDDFFRDVPLVEGPMRVLWLLGFGYVVARGRRFWPEILLFALMLLPTVVTQPSFHRAVGSLPLVYAFAAWGLGALARHAVENWKVDRRFVAAVLVFLIGWQGTAGFNRLYVERLPWAHGFYPEATVVGREMARFSSKGMPLAVHAGNWPHDALHFLLSAPSGQLREFRNYQPYNTASRDGLPELQADLKSGALARPALVFVETGREVAFLRALEANYLTQPFAELKMDDGRVIGRVFRVS